MSTSCKETDCDLLNLIEPLLDDESTQDSGSETGFSAQGYQTKYKTEVNVRVNSDSERTPRKLIVTVPFIPLTDPPYRPSLQHLLPHDEGNEVHIFPE